MIMDSGLIAGPTESSISSDAYRRREGVLEETIKRGMQNILEDYRTEHKFAGAFLGDYSFDVGYGLETMNSDGVYEEVQSIEVYSCISRIFPPKYPLRKVLSVQPKVIVGNPFKHSLRISAFYEDDSDLKSLVGKHLGTVLNAITSSNSGYIDFPNRGFFEFPEDVKKTWYNSKGVAEAMVRDNLFEGRQNYINSDFGEDELVDYALKMNINGIKPGFEFNTPGNFEQFRGMTNLWIKSYLDEEPIFQIDG